MSAPTVQIFTLYRQGPPGPSAISVVNVAALSQVPVGRFKPGVLAYVQPSTANALGVYYAYSPTNTQTPDGNLVVAAPAGRWLKLNIGLAVS